MALLFCNDDFDGPLNMALDEILWDESATGTPFLRLYSWTDRPALSLGYFQDAREVRADGRLHRLPYVRRLTGGGAIVHDHEITYSLALPARLAPNTNELYDRVHSAVAKALGDAGVPATVGDKSHHSGLAANLCFARSDRYAVRVRQVKIMGSAQRRRPDRVLMHGSLVLARSDAAPEVVGLSDLHSYLPDRDQLKAMLASAMGQSLRLQWTHAELPIELRDRTTRLAQSKYRSPDWNDRR